jgi:hypothetical protein
MNAAVCHRQSFDYRSYGLFLLEFAVVLLLLASCLLCRVGFQVVLSALLHFAPQLAFRGGEVA